MTESLLPPPGFDSWLDYVVATTEAPRDIHVQSLFNPYPWGREVSREEVQAAIHAELAELRSRASRT